MLSAMDWSCMQRLPAILGDSPSPARIASPGQAIGVADAMRSGRHPRPVRATRRRAPGRARRAAGADEAEETHDLALAHGETDAVDMRWPPARRIVATVELDRPRGRSRRLRRDRSTLRHGLSDRSSPRRSLARGFVVAMVADAHPAVAHDQDAIGDREDLGQAMGHEDDRDAAGRGCAGARTDAGSRPRSAPRSARRG